MEADAQLIEDNKRLAEKVERLESHLRNISTLDEDQTLWDAIDQAREALHLDSAGKGPQFLPGDRVCFIPKKTFGTVERQVLHYDNDERFWGNLFLKMDNGTRLQCNCWQTKKVEPKSDLKEGV